MRPFLGPKLLTFLTAMSTVGVFFFVVLGVLYQAKYPQVALHMSNEAAAEAARSCFIAAGFYGLLLAAMIWQCVLLWMTMRGQAMTTSPKPISLQDVAMGVPNISTGLYYEEDHKKKIA